MKFVGTVLDSFKGLRPGFDFLRLWLAGSVIWFHVFVVSGQMAFLERTPVWFYVYALLPMFFALSGFLIAASAQRLSLQNFLINRGLRIVPALAVAIGVSALILGPLMTSLPIGEYFSRPEFWRYFTNMFGWFQYRLPGVFEHNPSTGVVNLSLWTVPFQFGCYALIAAVIVLKLAQRPLYILGLAVLLLIVPAVGQFTGYATHGGGQKIPGLMRYAFFSRGAVLFPAFLLGACGYYCREKLPYSLNFAILIVIAFLAVAIIGHDDWKYSYIFSAFSIPGLVYLTIIIGLMRFPKIPYFSTGDYSYGLYVYGYPIQQAIVVLLPDMKSWLPFFLLSFALATVMATFSWHVIEKPILARRRKFSFVARLREGDAPREIEVSTPGSAPSRAINSHDRKIS